jgi:GAF domain-containing protein
MHGFLEKVLEYLLDSLPRIDTAAIILMDYQTDNKEKKRKVVTRSREGLEPREGIISRRVVDQALREGTQVRISSSVYDTDIDLSESKGTIQVGSVLCVPMISNSVIWGAVYVDSIQTQKGFRDEDVLLLNSLSGFLAVAMEKAMLSKRLKKIPNR